VFGRITTTLCLAVTVGLPSNAQSQVTTQTNSIAHSSVRLTDGSNIVREGFKFFGQPAETRRFDLTLDDAIQRALERNLDIAVERINPQLLDLSLAEQNAFYRPTVSLNLNSSSRTNPGSTQLDGGEITETDATNFDVSVSQPFKWGGGSFRLGFDNNRQETTNAFSSFNPGYRSGFVFEYTQPLLRGFRIDNTRSQIQVTQINRDISDIDLRQIIINTVAEVENTYWELLYAVASVDVQHQALDLADQFVRDNQTRVEIGILAPIDVVQSQAEAAARRQTLSQAQQVLRTSELALKRLIVGGTQDELWNTEINPVDQPRLNQPPIDIANAVDSALGQRTDLGRAKRQQDINELQVRALRNNTLPALDLVGAFNLQGQGGDLLVRDFSNFGGQVSRVIPGGYRDAIDQIVDVRFPGWSVALQMSYPIGTSSEEAALERARLQIRQTEAQLRQLELNVATEVTNAALQVESIQGRIEAATASRELAEQQLVAEESKFSVGMSTNFFVVQTQRDLATAQDTELRAILDYQKALVEFDRLQKTSLSRIGISIIGGG
jgi:outer membrane protein TolC